MRGPGDIPCACRIHGKGKLLLGFAKVHIRHCRAVDNILRANFSKQSVHLFASGDIQVAMCGADELVPIRKPVSQCA